MDPATAGTIIVGSVEAMKLANALLQAYMDAARLAKMTTADIDAAYVAAKKIYYALPKPEDIPDPK